jgi:hypothetical protein
VKLNGTTIFENVVLSWTLFPMYSRG